MRLIDADKFTQQITGTTLVNNYPVNKALALCKLIDSQPTACDVDKVVEELRQRSKEYNSCVRLHGKPEEMLTEEAIEIIKAGGIDGK